MSVQAGSYVDDTEDSSNNNNTTQGTPTPPPGSAAPQAPNNPAPQTSSSSGIAAPTSSGGSSVPTSNGNSPAPTSSGFAGSFNNLSKYINANQNFDKDQGGLAGVISGNINNQATNFNNNLSGAQNAFNTGYNNSVNSFDLNNTNNSNLFNNAISDPNSFVNGSTVVNGNTNVNSSQPVTIQPANPTPGSFQAILPPSVSIPESPSNNTPTTLSTSPTGSTGTDNINAFNNIVNANYSGPQGLESLNGPQSLSSLQQQGTSLTNNINNAQTENGRFNLLQSMFGGNNSNYSKGQQNLDNLFLQSNQDQLGQLQALRPTAEADAQKLQNNETADEQQAQGAQTLAQTTQTNARGQLNSAANTFLNNLNNQATTANTTNNNLYGQLTGALAGNTSDLTPAVQKIINGMSGSGFNASGTPTQNTGMQNAYNQALINDKLMNANQFVTQGLPVTPQEAATAQQYAELAAYNQLMGGNVQGAGNLANPTNSAAIQSFLGQNAQSGQTAIPYNFNQGAYTNAVQQAQGDYNKAVGAQTAPVAADNANINNLQGAVQRAATQADNLAASPIVQSELKTFGVAPLPANATLGQKVTWLQQLASAGNSKNTNPFGVSPVVGVQNGSLLELNQLIPDYQSAVKQYGTDMSNYTAFQNAWGNAFTPSGGTGAVAGEGAPTLDWLGNTTLTPNPVGITPGPIGGSGGVGSGGGSYDPGAPDGNAPVTNIPIHSGSGNRTPVKAPPLVKPMYTGGQIDYPKFNKLKKLIKHD